MYMDKTMLHGTEELESVLSELRGAGENPQQSLMDRARSMGEAIVQPLIEMALDEHLHHSPADSPVVWAPLHALRILGELGSPEAIVPLLALFDVEIDDSLGRLLPEVFGGFGEPAVIPLRALLFDRNRGVIARSHAATSLAQLALRHPETRASALAALVARLDPTEYLGPMTR